MIWVMLLCLKTDKAGFYIRINQNVRGKKQKGRKYPLFMDFLRHCHECIDKIAKIKKSISNETSNTNCMQIQALLLSTKVVKIPDRNVMVLTII